MKKRERGEVVELYTGISFRVGRGSRFVFRPSRSDARGIDETRGGGDIYTCYTCTVPDL